MSTAVQSETTALTSGTWELDPVHSSVGFEIDYAGGTFRGSFERVEAALEVTDGSGSLRGRAPVSGIQARLPQLAGHLQSPDFFDAATYPDLSFTTAAVPLSPGQHSIDGELTMRGQTRAVSLQVGVSEPTQHFMGHNLLSLRLEAVIDRTAYGLNWNQQLPNGKPALADEVRIAAELYFRAP